MLLKENQNRASVVLNLEDEDDIVENDFVFVTVGNENEVKKATGESCLLPDFEVSDIVELRNESEVSELKTENVEDKQLEVSSADEKIPVVSPENQDKVPAVQQLENENEGSLSASSSYVDEKVLIAIRKAFPDFSAFRRIVVTGDLILVPRIRLKFVFGCPGGSYDLVPDGTILKGIVATGFRRSQFFPKKLPLSDDDIHVHYLVPPKLTADNFEIIAKGYFYFRDSKLNSEDLYLEFQKKLIKKLGKYSVKYFGTLFETRVSTEGDLTEMISGLSQEKPPTIVLKGVPCEWFADHQSMENLRAFIHTLGRLRNLVVDDKNVSIQFEDFEECSKA